MNTTSAGRPRPFVLVILDGWGINPRKEGNAIAMARTPNIDKLAREWPHTAVRTSGEAVGLPEGQMGNSEVGHQNIGAGKRVLQDYTRVSESIRDGSFFQNPALLKAVEHVKKNASQLHMCGLLGNGGVHFGRSRRGNPHQLVVAGNEVSILAEIANYQLSSLADRRPSRDRAQLPCEVVG